MCLCTLDTRGAAKRGARRESSWKKTLVLLFPSEWQVISFAILSHISIHSVGEKRKETERERTRIQRPFFFENPSGCSIFSPTVLSPQQFHRRLLLLLLLFCSLLLLPLLSPCVSVCVCVSEISSAVVVRRPSSRRCGVFIRIFNISPFFVLFSSPLLSLGILVLFPPFLCRMLALQSAEDDDRRQFLPYFSSCVPLFFLFFCFSYYFYIFSFFFFFLFFFCLLLLLLPVKEGKMRAHKRERIQRV